MTYLCMTYLCMTYLCMTYLCKTCRPILVHLCWFWCTCGCGEEDEDESYSILLSPVASRGMVPMYSDEFSGPVIVRVISRLDFLLLQNVFIDVGCNQLSVVGAWRRTSRLKKKRANQRVTQELHRDSMEALIL